MNWNGFKITINGKEIEPLSHIEYEERKGCTFPQMEYYHRKGDAYYFKDAQGRRLTIVSHDGLSNYIKYGQVIDMELTE